MNRREFVASSLVSATALGTRRLGADDQKLEILFLGGTNYVGPAIVESALRSGHHLTLFNRGRTNPQLFPNVEKRRGNRFPHRGSGLESLKAGTWDVVIDTWQGPPYLVGESARLLEGRVKQYIYISSMAVYGRENIQKVGVDETAPLPEAPNLQASKEMELGYARRKQLAEQAIRDVFPQNHAIHRCPAIIGCFPSGRVSDVKMAYWPVRIDRGGEILAPGEPADTTQWIDVNDLARWIVKGIELKHRGIYNVLRTQRMDEFLYGLKAITGARGHLTWVPASFLFERGLESWSDIPLWVSHQERERGIYQFSNGKALSAGLEFSPMSENWSAVRRGFYDFHEASELFGASPACCALGVQEVSVLTEWKRSASML